MAESQCENLWSGFEKLDNIAFLDDRRHRYIFTGEIFDSLQKLMLLQELGDLTKHTSSALIELTV